MELFSKTTHLSRFVTIAGVKETMWQWAQADPDTATAWITSCQDPDICSWSTTYLFEALSDNPATAKEAIQFMMKVPNAAKRAQLTRSLGLHLSNHDELPDDLIATALELARPFESEPMLASLHGSYAVRSCQDDD